MDLLKHYEHWTTARVARHVLYWMVWSWFYILVNYLSYEEEKLWQWIAFESAVLPVKVAFTYFVAYFLMPRFLYSKKFRVFAMCFLGALVVFGSMLYLVYDHIVNGQIMADLPHHRNSPFIYKGIELTYIASIFTGFKFFQNYQLEQSQNQKLIKEKAEAELKYLKNQIQPHFLFNTLNNIYGLVLSGDKKVASETIVEFSNLLSYMLYESNVPKVPLEKELLHLESYIQLEKLRYGKRLDISFSKDLQRQDVLIAPLLLIPLIENAFKHGPAKEKSNSFIAVSLIVSEEHFIFTVENSFKNDLESAGIQSGIGLANVKKRLGLIYPDQHELKVEKGKTFQVQLKLDIDD